MENINTDVTALGVNLLPRSIAAISECGAIVFLMKHPREVFQTLN